MQQLIIEVPDELAVQVGEALQASYPDVIVGTTTIAEATRAVIAFWMANLLADHAARKVREAGQEQIAVLQEQLGGEVSAARSQAWQAVKAVMTSGQLPSSPTTTIEATPTAEGA